MKNEIQRGFVRVDFKGDCCLRSMLKECGSMLRGKVVSFFGCDEGFEIEEADPAFDADELAAVLSPLADIDLEGLDRAPDDQIFYGRNNSVIRVGDVRRAREFLVAHCGRGRACG